MSDVRPLGRGGTAVLGAVPQLAARLEKLIWRTVYEAASARRGENWTPLMNYGYASLDDAGPEVGDPMIDYGLRLYEQVAGAIDLTACDVLEVGCGRGGGAAYVHERLKPRSMTGLDVARTAVEQCRSQYERPGLRFVVGDAEALPFQDDAYDVVLNVESSHCYPDVPRFLREVRRVLRPGGTLLIADLRRSELSSDTEHALLHKDDIASWRRQLSEAGFRAVEEEDITANVIRALQLGSPSRRARIERRFPEFLRPYALAFSGVEGSSMYQAYVEGKMTYLRLVLERN